MDKGNIVLLLHVRSWFKHVLLKAMGAVGEVGVILASKTFSKLLQLEKVALQNGLPVKSSILWFYVYFNSSDEALSNSPMLSIARLEPVAINVRVKLSNQKLKLLSHRTDADRYTVSQ